METTSAQAADPVSPVSEAQILEAATNSPALSPDEFQLGERTFKVVYLPYDDYVQFLGHIQPVLEVLMGKKADKEGIAVPGINLSPSVDSSSLIKFCSKSLPEMVRLSCKQTDPKITIEEIKTLAQSPFVLTGIVLKQVSKNNVIQDFTSFFAQMTPLLRVPR